MTPREIDALVAEKVMGWTLSHRLGYGWPISGATVPAVKCADYSTDIAAAWEVVEKMRADEWSFYLSSFGYPRDVAIVAFCRNEIAGPTLKGEATADFAARAICLAALKAVGVEVEGASHE